MSAKKQSKREKKISKVMGEFKEGTLKSGGSGRKVTNPKQAIAIALSEANAMNQGGMMYNEIMNRPMFQTPQMRQGGGIMAGVAPIRGYAEGDLVEDDDSIIASLLSQAEELPEVLSNLTMDDAIGFVKENPEVLLLVPGLGQYGLAARGLQLGARGVQRGGQKLASLIRGPRKVTEADLAAPKPGPRTMGQRDIMGTNVAPKESGQRVIRQGERFDPRATRTEAQSPKLSTPSQSATPKPAARKADAPETEGGIKSLGQRAAGTLRKGVGITALTGATAYLLQMPIVQDLINQGFGIDELMEMPEIRALLGPDMDDYAEKRQEELLTDYTQSRLPDVATARKEGFPEEKGGGKTGGDEKKEAPKTFLDMLKGAGTQFKDFLQDPANQYALAKAGQATEGIAPRNFASDFALGKEEYKQLEAQREKGTALEENLALLTRLKPEASVDELLDILLSKDTASELAQQVRAETLSLFGELRDDDMNTGVSDAELLARAQNLVFGTMTGVAPAAASRGETIDLEPTE